MTMKSSSAVVLLSLGLVALPAPDSAAQKTPAEPTRKPAAGGPLKQVTPEVKPDTRTSKKPDPSGGEAHPGANPLPQGEEPKAPESDGGLNLAAIAGAGIGGVLLGFFGTRVLTGRKKDPGYPPLRTNPSLPSGGGGSGWTTGSDVAAMVKVHHNLDALTKEVHALRESLAYARQPGRETGGQLSAADMKGAFKHLASELDGIRNDLQRTSVKVEDTARRVASRDDSETITAITTTITGAVQKSAHEVSEKLDMVGSMLEGQIGQLGGEIRQESGAIRRSVERVRLHHEYEKLPDGLERLRAARALADEVVRREPQRLETWMEPLSRLASDLEALSQGRERPGWLEDPRNRNQVRQVLFRAITNQHAPLHLPPDLLDLYAAFRAEIERYQSYLLGAFYHEHRLEPIAPLQREPFNADLHRAQGEGWPTADPALHNHIQQVVLPGFRLGGEVVEKAEVVRYLHRRGELGSGGPAGSPTTAAVPTEVSNSGPARPAATTPPPRAAAPAAAATPEPAAPEVIAPVGAVPASEPETTAETATLSEFEAPSEPASSPKRASTVAPAGTAEFVDAAAPADPQEPATMTAAVAEVSEPPAPAHEPHVEEARVESQPETILSGQAGSHPATPTAEEEDEF